MTRTSPRIRRALRGAAAWLVLAVLAGCATLPSSGTVQEVETPRGTVGQVSPVAYSPTPDAEPEQIVDGFLQAVGAGAADEFSVAREFLDGPVARSWDPRAQVRVYAASDDRDILDGEDGSVRVQVAAAASVDAEGRYTEAPPGTTIELEFSLLRNAEGQWRIVDLEDGILLSPAVFDAQYDAHSLYFLTADRQALVPDLRWFPERHATSMIVRSLLEGPSRWLAPGVTTAFPDGVMVGAEGINVVENVAQIDLSEHALTSSSLDRALMTAQLTDSLRNVRSIGAVEVTVDGQNLDGDQTVPALARNAYVPASPVVLLVDGELRRLSGEELQEIDGVGSLAAVDAREPALPYDDQSGVPVVLDGTDRLVTVPVPGEEPILLREDADLTAPSIDPYGWVWTAARRGSSGVVAVTTETSTPVSAPWLGEGEASALRISRDGARAVVLWDVDGTASVGVTSVLRDVSGEPIALEDPVPVGEGIVNAIDVAWVDELTIAVLDAGAGEGLPVVHLVTIGGPTSTLPPVADAEQIASATGDLSLVLVTSDGDLYIRAGLGWSRSISGVTDPTFPG